MLSTWKRNFSLDYATSNCSICSNQISINPSTHKLHWTFMLLCTHKKHTKETFVGCASVRVIHKMIENLGSIELNEPMKAQTLLHSSYEAGTCLFKSDPNYTWVFEDELQWRIENELEILSLLSLHLVTAFKFTDAKHHQVRKDHILLKNNDDALSLNFRMCGPSLEHCNPFYR